MNRAVAIALAVGVGATSCAGTIKKSVRPAFFSPPCPYYLGQPQSVRLGWECKWGNQGYDDCDHALEVTARCEGAACVLATILPGTYEHSGRRVISATPQELGRLRVVVDVAHLSGMQEQVETETCEVIPVPPTTITCMAHDPRTGDFVPCPTPIAVGTEIHLEIRGTIPFNHEPQLPRLRIDGDDPIGSDGECRREAEPAADEWIVRCALHPARGEHTLTVTSVPLPVVEYAFTVGT